MIDTRAILMLNGILILILGGAMALIGLVDVVTYNPEAFTFFLSAAVTAFVGAMLALTNRKEITRLNPRTLFLLIASAWAVLPLFAALPLRYGIEGFTFTNAYFEAVSGFTTTGATVISGLDHLPPSMLLWRSLLQWLGGVGVVVMAISALPLMRLGGMQIFRMEFAERIDKALPRATQIGGWITLCYLVLTFLCALFYYIAGMNAFDAINHAMTTVATGGYSTHDQSFLYFNNAWIDMIAVVFMIAGSLPFLHYIQMLRGRPLIFFKDSQITWFLTLLAIFIAIVALWLINGRDYSWLGALREAAFSVTSLMTGTGYGREDYGAWGHFVQPLLFVIMFIGGCAGSTTCGLKIFRLQVLSYVARAQITRLLQPNSVVILYYNKKPLQDGVADSVMGFFFFYVMIFGALAIGFGATGLDFITAASGAASALANVGPGLGSMIGPSGNYDGLTFEAKWLMCLGMLLGRLEIFTLLVLIFPKFWRD